jgi:hypothetical protein
MSSGTLVQTVASGGRLFGLCRCARLPAPAEQVTRVVRRR